MLGMLQSDIWSTWNTTCHHRCFCCCLWWEASSVKVRSKRIEIQCMKRNNSEASQVPKASGFQIILTSYVWVMCIVSYIWNSCTPFAKMQKPCLFAPWGFTFAEALLVSATQISRVEWPDATALFQSLLLHQFWNVLDHWNRDHYILNCPFCGNQTCNCVVKLQWFPLNSALIWVGVILGTPVKSPAMSWGSNVEFGRALRPKGWEPRKFIRLKSF